jgi:hypothetical protein
MTTPGIWLILLLAGAACAAELDTVKSEPDPNRRAELAVDAADHDLDSARQSWQGGDWTKAQSELDAMKKSAELADTSLEQTTRQPRNNHHYKTVEMKLRTLIRRVDAFRLEVDYEQRDAVNDVETRLQELHDRILDAVMTRRR